MIFLIFPKNLSVKSNAVSSYECKNMLSCASKLLWSQRQPMYGWEMPFHSDNYWTSSRPRHPKFISGGLYIRSSFHPPSTFRCFGSRGESLLEYRKAPMVQAMLKWFKLLLLIECIHWNSTKMGILHRSPYLTHAKTWWDRKFYSHFANEEIGCE